jgi:hypothetical protein
MRAAALALMVAAAACAGGEEETLLPVPAECADATAITYEPEGTYPPVRLVCHWQCVLPSGIVVDTKWMVYDLGPDGEYGMTSAGSMYTGGDLARTCGVAG